MMSNLLKNVRIYIREYCNCTSIHGFRYFGEKRTLFEKIWWFFVFILSLSVCVLSIYMVYRKWELSPVIVSLANRGTQIYKIPFPAVTICPESKTVPIKFNYTNVLNKIRTNENFTEKEAFYYEHMSLICDYTENFENKETANKSQNFHDILDEVKPDFQISRCRFRGKLSNCSQFFKPVLTEEGVCYSFNMLDKNAMFRENKVNYKNYHQFDKNSSKWSVDYGYSEDAGVLFQYPRRALLAGIRNGFSFKLTTRGEDLDPLCTDSFQGYKVLIHNPTSFPSPSQDHFKVPLDQSIVAEVNPSMITTSEAVRAYSKDRRRCYFQTERHLQYFKIYNANNCDIECLANFTEDFCGCVNFYMPRNISTNICSPAEAKCMAKAEQHLQTINLINKMDEFPTKLKSKYRISCDCLPSCTEINYDTEVSQSDWDWKRRYIALNAELSENLHLSALTIYFKNDDFITHERNELYGPIDFLANFGGLLGLFTGFSILSLMEIVYFLFVRIACNKYLYGQWFGENLRTVT